VEIFVFYDLAAYLALHQIRTVKTEDDWYCVYVFTISSASL
jgi:hypothetical protein